MKQIDDNYIIIQPIDIKDRTKKTERLKDKLNVEENIKISRLSDLLDPGIRDNLAKIGLLKTYNEKIEIICVNNKSGEKLVIHQVSSNNFDPQDLLDGLFQEYELYKEYNLDKKNYHRRIEYYGTDYLDSGCESDAAFTDILATPFVWNSNVNLKDINEKINSLEENHRLFIKNGEGNQVEFKPSLQYNFKTSRESQGIRYLIAKSICAFLNTNGGILYLGVTNEGIIQGLEHDFSLFSENHKDQFLVAFDRLLAYFFPLSVVPLIEAQFIEIEGKLLFAIFVFPAYDEPVFLNNPYNPDNKREFYIRLNASSRQIINHDEISKYMVNRQKRKT